MRYKVLGVETSNGNYNGNAYSGRNVYAQYPDSYHSERLTGHKVDKLWISDRLGVAPLSPDDEIEVYYNRYGKVDSVVVL